MKKTVAILGAEGNMGSAIAYSLAGAGYRTLVTGHRGKELTSLIGKLPILIAKIRLTLPQADVGFVFSPRDASWEADIIIPTIPYQDQAAVASEIRDVVTGKIVISVVNPLNDTFDRLLTPPTISAAEELAQLLPHSKIVKAFNTIFPLDLETPQITGQSVDIFVAGDDEGAIQQVMELVRDIGFHPLFTGQLAMSRTLESMMLLLAGLSIRNGSNSVNGWKVLHRAPSPGILRKGR